MTKSELETHVEKITEQLNVARNLIDAHEALLNCYTFRLPRNRAEEQVKRARARWAEVTASGEE